MRSAAGLRKQELRRSRSIWKDNRRYDGKLRKQLGRISADPNLRTGGEQRGQIHLLPDVTMEKLEFYDEIVRDDLFEGSDPRTRKRALREPGPVFCGRTVTSLQKKRTVFIY